MNAEELLKTLRDAGMQDDAIKALLDEASQSLAGPVTEEQNPPEPDQNDAMAGKLLGVEF